MRGRPRAPFLVQAYRPKAMRRLVTLALAVGLATLVAFGVVDALRGSGDTPSLTETTPPDGRTQPLEVEVERTAAPPPWVEDRDGLGDRLRRNGVRGTLYLSADGCLDGTERPLRALRVPEFELTEGPGAISCPFTVSADGQHAAGREAAWSASVAIFAAETTPDLFEVIDVKQPGGLGLAGSAPAFKPDGTLTHALSGRVVELSDDCGKADELISPQISFGRDQLGPYCSRTAVSRHELARALPSGVRLGSVDALVWLSRSRMLAVLRTAQGPWLAAFEHGRSLGYANGLASRSTTQPLADPTGRYVALTPGGYLEVYDRNALRVWASSIEGVAFDWSPDGDWLAYTGNDRNVYLLRTVDWTTRFSLQAGTDGLAWR
jgi:hypothetical protein